IVLRINSGHAQVLDSFAHITHLTGHLGPLDDSGRIGGSANAARRAVKHRSVCGYAAGKTMPFDFPITSTTSSALKISTSILSPTLVASSLASVRTSRRTRVGGTPARLK